MKRKGIEIEDKGGGAEDKKSGRITETIMKCREKDTAIAAIIRGRRNSFEYFKS